MTQVHIPTPGAGTAATRPFLRTGKVGDKKFTAQPDPGHRTATSLAHHRQGMLSGVKRLLRAAIQGPLPRAGNPLQQALRQMDTTYERLLRTLLDGDAPAATRFNFALAEIADAETAYAAAAGRSGMSGIVRAQPPRGDRPGLSYVPPLAPFTLTDLLLLRERLPRLLRIAPDTGRAGVAADSIAERCLAAVENEIAGRERPFVAVLRILGHDAPTPDDLEGPLCVLARAVSDRERRGEHAARFLADLAGRRNNDELENAAATLASAPLCAVYGTVPFLRSPGRVAISARDGGARACARLLKEALDSCIRSRLVVRARLALRQPQRDRAAAAHTIGMVLGLLERGVTAMNGGMASGHGHRDTAVMSLFAKALAEDESLNLAGYLSGMDEAVLQGFERHLAFLPAARRKAVLLAIDKERRARRDGARATRSADGRAGHSVSRTMERVGMQATPILARVIARIRSDLRDRGDHGADRDAHAASPASEAVTRMAFEITTTANGDYEVSVTAGLVSPTGDEPVSLVYRSRISSDLRPLRSSFRHDGAGAEPDHHPEKAAVCHG
jgi:hypothetical protein